MDDWEKYPSFGKIRMALERGRLSPTTAEAYVNAVGSFARALDLGDPERALGEIRRSENREKFLNDAVDRLRETTTDTMVDNAFKAVRYWLRVNGVVVDWDAVIVPTSEAVVEDRIPSKEEMRRLLKIANIRDQSVALVGSSSGLRLNTLLTLSRGDVSFDFPDVARIMVKRVYVMAGKTYRTGRKISKKRKFFVTFTTPEARRALEEYLRWRELEGERVTDESPLFTRMDRKGMGRFLGKHAFDVQWRKLLKRSHLAGKAGNSPWHELHFHTLKKYAETKMIDAGVKNSYREFFLGHKGEYLELNYFRGEEAKCLEEYRKAVPHLSVSETGIEERLKKVEEMRERLGPEVLRELEGIGVRVAKAKEEEERPETEANGGNLNSHAIISEKQLLSYLDDGWEIIKELSNGHIVVRLKA